MKSETQPSKSLGVRIALGVVAFALLGGMTFTFLPYLQQGGLSQNDGTPAFKVNDQTVTEEDIKAFQSRSAIFNNTEGMIGDDLKRVMVSYLIQEAALKDDASSVKIANSEVQKIIDDYRKANNLQDRQKWREFVTNQLQTTEPKLREDLRNNLRIQKRSEEVKASATVTDPEAKLFYEAFKDQFKSEPRVVARQIVVKDQAKAADLLKQARAGADFAKLATENNTGDLAKTAGAVGATGTETEPKEVAKLAFPEAVSTAVFALKAPGLTDVIKDGSNFYIVKVEKILPAAAKTFDEAKNDVMTRAKAFKEAQVVEAWQESVVKNAKVEFIDSKWKVEDPIVAVVDKQNVKYSEVLNTLYSNQQISQFIQPGNAQAESFVNQFFKPQAVESLINQYAAVEIAKKLNQPFIGGRAQLEAELVAYQGRNETVTEAEIEAFYKQNQTQYAVPGSASLKEASFKDKNKALAFRDSFVKGGKDFTKDAGKAGATVNETGTVTDTSSNVSPVILQSIFKSGRLTGAGEGSVSDVLEVDKKFVVAYVSDLVKPSVKTLAEVHDDIREQVLQQKISQKGQAFITAERKKLKVENKLQDILKAQQTEVDAANPKTLEDSQKDSGSAGGTNSGGETSGTENKDSGTTGTENKDSGSTNNQ
ncbi:peptidylprolyl isomerase [Deinococcus cellulosilyticus]|uniref:peptidylprolyl isomerase n=1 Tax=Deinococcus cellulosilyticus (strain DSM 18568 / NBRC 106333 / KACC 11606 / 5516J-15) TaxID=1223518 RepID=A0A511MXR4_DEIC1|nr:peptidylprolyl isomerase [Deinococcus cellulosilyticus]GEM45350.1 peptidylprolyl isomerase [Deinococcus cellulosilyticus NBRC 106333 = KACC 11606]